MITYELRKLPATATVETLEAEAPDGVAPEGADIFGDVIDVFELSRQIPKSDELKSLLHIGAVWD